MNMERINWQAIKTTLHNHYSAPLKTVFIQFRNGAIYFAVGLMTIFMANTHMQSSLLQEVVMLLALALMVFGFIYAMLAQMRLIIGRFYQFIRRK